MVVRPFSLFLVQAKMKHSILKRKKKDMSNSERSKKRRIVKQPIAIEARRRSLSPALSNSVNYDSLSRFYGICDLCMEPRKPGGPMLCGRAVTYVNAYKLVHLRYMAELALKLYNDKKSRSFRLVKVCKINHTGGGFYGLTFRAQEDGSEECPIFRGVVRVVGGAKAKFCGIKDDDVITLLPWDDDYVS